MSHQFREIDRSQPISLPGNLEGWLDGNDLAHCIVDVVEALDTRAIEAAYRGGGSAPYRPKMLLALLFTATPRGFSPAGRSSGPPTNSFPSCISPGACIRITTASIHSGSAF